MNNSLIPSIKYYNKSNEKWAVILNHEKFENESYREGTNEDVKNLTFTLKRVKCNYVVFDDLNKDEILNKIPLYVESNLEQLKEMDGLMFFVLTHGDVSDKIYARDSGYNLYMFVNQFCDEKLPIMANKPKLFCLCACRGTRVRTTLPIKVRGGYIQVDSVMNKEPVIQRHMYKNFLIAFGSTVNAAGLRNRNSGTHFIETLCSTFNSFVLNLSQKKMDIMDILEQTNKRLIQKTGDPIEEVQKPKQVGQMYCSLTTPFIFRKTKIELD